MSALILHTKLTPPPLTARTLLRPRVTQRLLEALDYPLTLVQAGTGYGKSTALAALQLTRHLVAWYTLEREDADATVFLLHLFASLHRIVPTLPEALTSVLEDVSSRDVDRWQSFLTLLLNALSASPTPQPAFLVLNDAHHLDQAPAVLNLLERFITHRPAWLHVILATRRTLPLPSLVTWRVRGEVLEIAQHELAFTAEEVDALFADIYGLPLTPEQVERLTQQTEGWVIALQLVWQMVRSRAVESVAQALERLPAPDAQFFTYLAQEVMEQLPVAWQHFLKRTAVLREFDAALCDALLGIQNSADILRDLINHGLFISEMGRGRMHYQPLFRKFLLNSLTPEEERAAHRQAAACLQQRGEREMALEHLFRAGDHEAAAHLLEELGAALVRNGQLDRLERWLHQFPPDLLASHPRLLSYLGDVRRLRSQFEEALSWYQQAQHHAQRLGQVEAVAQALRGQARVYLDTVNPAQAEALLEEALRITDGLADRQARATLLEMLAENRLNLGRPEEAETLRAQAQALREEGPNEEELPVRVLLRTGQLEQARRILEARAALEQEMPVLRPRAHRETLLLLALIHAFEGDAEAAYRCAVAGTERGQMLNSPFITGVGLMRQGHAWLLKDTPEAYERACQCYRETIKISDTLAVPRLKAEAYWGLCRAHGFHGALEAAERAAEQGLALTQQAGDIWVGALIQLSLGASYTLAGRSTHASSILNEALAAFHNCSDRYGETLARLWLCLTWWESGDVLRLKRDFAALQHLVTTHGYGYLFTRRTFLGPPDVRRLVPLLLWARDEAGQRAFAEALLGNLGLRTVEAHPGYQLRVQTFGAFRVWRGKEEIAPAEWRRESARQLLQVLITYREQRLEREQIIEMLWPEQDPETGARDFKVALSTLFKALEPRRAPNAPSAYIVREGTLYGLRSNADIELDVAEFERFIREANARYARDPQESLSAYQQALALYSGDFLQDNPYAPWCMEERERLRTLYLRSAERTALLLSRAARWDEVLTLSEAMLERDPCWERAYQLQMQAYLAQGLRAQALRVYQRCVERLQSELQVAPSPDTQALFRRCNVG